MSDGIHVHLLTAGAREVQPMRTVTGTTYTLVAADHGSTVEFTNPAGCTVTVPAGVFARNKVVTLVAYAGAGAIQVNPGAGFLPLVARPGTRIAGNGGGAQLLFRSATEAYLLGDLT